MVRRVHVEWQTQETVDWEADFDVPDEVADDEVVDYFTDGNCGDLVDYEDDSPGEGNLQLFEREVERVTWLEGAPLPPPPQDFTFLLEYHVEAGTPEQAAQEFRSQLTDPRITFRVLNAAGEDVEV